MIVWVLSAPADSYACELSVLPSPRCEAVYRHQLRPVITKGAHTMNTIFGDSRHG
ncbi:hypothetical protein [Nonomuraea sp. 10N515B]|uniref:hypothetical protein n=1 Tax=Nonomuraea sp. 10N515B TaxID=3457422 RepID=UPI003FCD10A9